MNKTTSMHLGGRIFHVEEPAYEKLDAYLKALKAHFATYHERDEIISDIEARIAEMLEESVTTAKPAVIVADVERVIQSMGAPEALGDEGAKVEEPVTPPVSGAKSRKRLYRNPDNRIVGGVLSGLAAYLGVDPVMTRGIYLFLFVLGIFSAGISSIFLLLLYIGAMLVIPEAETATQKVEMQGESMTVSNITQQVKEEAVRVQEQHAGTLQSVKQKSATFIESIIGIVKRIILFFVGFLRIVLGLALTIGAAIWTFILTFGAAVLVFNVRSPWVESELQAFAGRDWYFAAVVLGYVIIIVPVLFILFVGGWLLRRKSLVPVSLAVGLAGLWIVALIGGGVLGIDKGPEAVDMVRAARTVKMDGARTFEEKDFAEISVQSVSEIAITSSPTFFVRAEGEAQALERLEVKKEGDRLTVAHREPESFRICLFCFRRPVRVVIGMPRLQDVRAQNGSHVTIEGFTQEEMSLMAKNGSAVYWNGSGTRLVADVSSASLIELDGRVEEFRLTLDNGSRFDGSAFVAKWAEISVRRASRGDMEMNIGNTSSTSAAVLQVENGSAFDLSGETTSLTADIDNGSVLNSQDLDAQLVSLRVNNGSSANVKAGEQLTAKVTRGSQVEYVGNPMIQREVDMGSRLESR